MVQKYAEKKNPVKLFLVESGTCKALTERFERTAVPRGMAEKGVVEEKGELVRVTRDINKLL